MDKHTAPLQTAALAFEIVLDGQGQARTAPTRMRVIPDGHFDAVDGRPGNMEGVKAKTWFLDSAAASAVSAAFKAGGVKLPIDYEHQTLKAAENGQPAPAAGWITALEYSPGVGMLAHVTWTPAGRAPSGAASRATASTAVCAANTCPNRRRMAPRASATRMCCRLNSGMPPAPKRC